MIDVRGVENMDAVLDDDDRCARQGITPELRRIGLVLAIILARVFENLADFPAPIGIGIGTAIGSMLFSAIIGLAFGSYPAVRASRLSPIEALRSE